MSSNYSLLESPSSPEPRATEMTGMGPPPSRGPRRGFFSRTAGREGPDGEFYLEAPDGPGERLGIEDLDKFFQNVYNYFEGRGFWPCVLAKVFNVASLGFLIFFTLFLAGFVDWELTLSEEVIRLRPISFWQLSWFLKTSSLVSFVYMSWTTWVTLFELIDLYEIRDFYSRRLGIPEVALGTMQWGEVVRRLVDMQQQVKISIHVDVLNPHDIVNRIMRNDNYWIAIINRKILDLSLPYSIPFFSSRPHLTRGLEWNIQYVIRNFFFEDDGHTVRAQFLPAARPNVQQLAASLRSRFLRMALINAILAPFIALFIVIYAFFRYAMEFQREPSALSTRQWTLHSKWVTRELNELPHIYQQRMNAAYQPALKYLQQFPKAATVIIAKFFTFVLGSVLAVLLALSVYDDALVNGLQIGSRSVLWWLTVGAGVLAVARSQIPDENAVFQPEQLLRATAQYTHYMPRHWRHNAHQAAVQAEFEGMFVYRIMILLEEFLSVIFTPLMLWMRIPNCSVTLVEFFRDFTTNVDGVGHIVSFASFDFATYGSPAYGTNTEVEDPDSQPPMETYTKPPAHYRLRQGKMEKSFLNFKANHPDWVPPQAGEELIAKLSSYLKTQAGASAAAAATYAHVTGGTSSMAPVGAMAPGLGDSVLDTPGAPPPSHTLRHPPAVFNIPPSMVASAASIYAAENPTTPQIQGEGAVMADWTDPTASLVPGSATPGVGPEPAPAAAPTSLGRVPRSERLFNLLDQWYESANAPTPPVPAPAPTTEDAYETGLAREQPEQQPHEADSSHVDAPSESFFTG